MRTHCGNGDEIFAGAHDDWREAVYVFALEDTEAGRCVGTSTILADGFSFPDSLLNPVLGGYALTGYIPPVLTGTGTSFLMNLMVIDVNYPPFDFGIADAHEFVIQ